MSGLLKIVLIFIAMIVSYVNSQAINATKVKTNCVQFSVGSGTGCAWMCTYCSGQLGTNNYYFTDNVCTYEQGQGCVGNPIAGKMYTCCSVGKEKAIVEKGKKEEKGKKKDKIKKEL